MLFADKERNVNCKRENLAVLNEEGEYIESYQRELILVILNLFLLRHLTVTLVKVLYNNFYLLQTAIVEGVRSSRFDNLYH